MPARAAAPASKPVRQASFHSFTPFQRSISLLANARSARGAERLARNLYSAPELAAELSPRRCDMQILLREVRHRLPILP